MKRKQRPARQVVKYHMRDQIFSVDFNSIEDMPYLKIMTPYCPYSWCVIMLFHGLFDFGDPLMCECFGTLGAALDCVVDYADVADLNELHDLYGSNEIPHFDFEIWNLLPFDPYAND